MSGTQIPFTEHPLAKWSNLRWKHATGILFIHLLAILAFFPQFFTWSALVAAIFCRYFFGTLGINVGFHRLIGHHGFKCPQWLERTLAVLGVCTLQGGPLRWIGQHRMHHADSDDHDDIHSPHRPIRSFLWSHVGWICFDHPRCKDKGYYAYVKDLTRQPFYVFLNKHWLGVYLAHAVVIAALGFAWGALTGADPVFMALSWTIWAVVARTIYVWHITWLVNSAAHIWGSRAHETPDQSRNNWWVALLTSGEGWHNNHHAHPRSAAHGFKWWQFDESWLVIRTFALLGLAWDIARPPQAKALAPAAA